MGEHIKSRQRLAFSDDRAFVHYQLPNPLIFDSYDKHSQQFNYDFNQVKFEISIFSKICILLFNFYCN